MEMLEISRSQEKHYADIHATSFSTRIYNFYKNFFICKKLYVYI